jgi:predicted nuclease of restriction endonuclease-like (RecB) superfamily
MMWGTEVLGRSKSAQHMKMKAVVYYYRAIVRQMASRLVDRDIWQMSRKDVTQILIKSPTMTSKRISKDCYILDWYNLQLE